MDKKIVRILETYGFTENEKGKWIVELPSYEEESDETIKYQAVEEETAWSGYPVVMIYELEYNKLGDEWTYYGEGLHLSSFILLNFE